MMDETLKKIQALIIERRTATEERQAEINKHLDLLYFIRDTELFLAALDKRGDVV